MGYEQIFRLDGKTALVAGASRGIGLAIARALAQSGAKTILAARSVEALERHVEELREKGCQAEATYLDTTDAGSIVEVARRYPEVDILMNVSGTNIRKPFESYTVEEYNLLLQTNLHGLVLLTQEVGRQMIQRGRGGRIVFIGSLTTVIGLPFLSIYTITKSALGGLTRALAAEWGRYNILVNCILPGFILTDLNRAMWQNEQMHEWLKGAQALGRLGSPEEIAPLAVFLASPGADYITGQCIAVDGGHITTSIWPFRPAGA